MVADGTSMRMQLEVRCSHERKKVWSSPQEAAAPSFADRIQWLKPRLIKQKRAGDEVSQNDDDDVVDDDDLSAARY